MAAALAGEQALSELSEEEGVVFNAIDCHRVRRRHMSERELVRRRRRTFQSIDVATRHECVSLTLT
jgi:hypothetical protein